MKRKEGELICEGYWKYHKYIGTEEEEEKE